MKFELTSETKIVLGRTLYRIRALISFGIVKSGDLGGWVEKAGNIDVSGNAWVYGDAQVYGDARVSGDAQVSGDAWVSPVHIQGLPYPITISDRQIRIGCQVHTTEEWSGFDPRDIARMDGCTGAKFWKAYKSLILSIAAKHQKPIEAKGEAKAA